MNTYTPTPTPNLLCDSNQIAQIHPTSNDPGQNNPPQAPGLLANTTSGDSVNTLNLLCKKRMHSICIPRIDANIPRSFIFRVFVALDIGYIDRILELPIKSDLAYKRVIVNVRWNNSRMSHYFRDRFDQEMNVKVVYSMPWYWICVANRFNSPTRM